MSTEDEPEDELGGEPGDEIDLERAQRLAWRTLRPDQSVDALLADADAAEAEAQEEASARDSEGIKKWRRESREKSEALATAIERAWAIGDPALQAQSIGWLVRQAGALQFGLAVMGHHFPVESVRLVRMAVRHYHHLSPASRRAFHGLLLWLHLEHTESQEALVELARAGLVDVVACFGFQFHEKRAVLEARWPELPARLARILDESDDPAARQCAVDVLRMVGARGAEPSLRRALRLPQLRVRTAALELLLEDEPPALGADDVLQQLGDLIAHPPGYRWCGTYKECVRDYAYSLRCALARVRPKGGAQILEALVAQVYQAFIQTDLDWQWALAALAAAYPERAMEPLQKRLRNSDAWIRYHALEAAVLMPEAEARSLLLRGASDGAPRVAERARSLWLGRFRTACPVDELAGLPMRLLDGPPSETLRARLAVLREGQDEERREVVRALLREGRGSPERAREALAAITFALGDDHMLPGLGFGYRLDDRLWKSMIRQFGIRGALDAALWLGDRYRDFISGSHYLSSLRRALDSVRLPRAELAAIRARALRLLDGEEAHRELGLALIDRMKPVGGWPDAWDRLWAIALAPEAGAWQARQVLRRWRPAAEVHARTLKEMEDALAAREWTRLAAAISIGVRRGAGRAAALAERLLAGPYEPAAEHAYTACAKALREMGRLDDAWIEAALADPKSLRFTFACRLLRSPLDPKVRKLLERALSSTARGSRPAREALETLVMFGEVRGHPRFRGVLDRVDPMQRWRLIELMNSFDLPERIYHDHLVELLTTDDDELLDEICQWAALRSYKEDCGGALREALPRVQDDYLRSEIERILGIQMLDYWVDPKDKDDR